MQNPSTFFRSYPGSPGYGVGKTIHAQAVDWARCGTGCSISEQEEGGHLLLMARKSVNTVMFLFLTLFYTS